MTNLTEVAQVRLSRIPDPVFQVAAHKYLKNQEFGADNQRRWHRCLLGVLPIYRCAERANSPKLISSLAQILSKLMMATLCSPRSMPPM